MSKLILLLTLTLLSFARPAFAQTGGTTDLSNSVLATGTWYKIAVPTGGIFKIDQSFLQSLGVSPASVNPKNIRIYGNGGTVMPEEAGVYPYDDLEQNAIFVQASGTTFGANDYVLFYANGPRLWEPDFTHKKFKHTNHYYENRSYYFISFDQGPGKRITSEDAVPSGGTPITKFDAYAVIDQDSFNIGKMGKIWWSHQMHSIDPTSLNQQLTMNLGSVSGPVTLDMFVGNKSDAGGNRLSVAVNGVTRETFVLGANRDDFLMAQEATDTFHSGPNVTIGLKYSPNGNGSGFLNYLRFNYQRPLSFENNFLAFRSFEASALFTGQDAVFTISNAPSGLNVWDITDPLQPVNLQGQATGGNQYAFSSPGGSLREFVAFQGNQFPRPEVIGPVPNQNLHGLSTADLIIVTPPSLKASAERLAAFHRSYDNKSVIVALTTEIYNEFSSGSQDIGGIRNFIKMFYDRAGSEAEIPENVLLFGAASYDYKNRIANNTNLVPTFQTLESGKYDFTYSSDDYFALLDDGESVYDGASRLDIGLGRIPAKTPAEAEAAIDKIVHYHSPESFGPWRNVVAFVADDVENGMNHLRDCETANEYLMDSLRAYNLYKIYSDAYHMIATSGGGRYPQVNKAINDRIFNGTLFMSYSGHGNPERWSHEAILTAADYNNWRNADKLPVIMTATCDFGRFDNPEEISAGARLMLQENGGAIALITTTQAVFPGANTALTKAYVREQFNLNAEGRYPTLGQALVNAKNNTTHPSSANNQKFVVLGDPALRPAIPLNQVQTDRLYFLHSDGSQTPADTIKALGRYVLKGSVTSPAGVLLSDFNGTVDVSIFDKRTTLQTVNTHPRTTPTYELQTNLVAKVKGEVEQGNFQVTFIAPKDINYDLGKGKISYYAASDRTDARGADTQFSVGGYNEFAEADNVGPEVAPYIDDDKFRDGGVTGPNPMLYVKLFDENGINVSGGSIGHDLVAILDGDVQNPLVMNDYYQTLPNDYRNGYVYFPLYNLPDGIHTVRVKAWDTYNNSGEGTVTFEVKNQEKGFISELYNYPNPFTDVTHFVFQHNLEGQKVNAHLEVFSAGGAKVWERMVDMEALENRSEIIWNGQDKDNKPLAKGVYFYRLRLSTPEGVSATAYQKLVLLR